MKRDLVSSRRSGCRGRRGSSSGLAGASGSGSGVQSGDGTSSAISSLRAGVVVRIAASATRSADARASSAQVSASSVRSPAPRIVRVRIQTRHGSPGAAGGSISALASTVSTAAARVISRWTPATTLLASGQPGTVGQSTRTFAGAARALIVNDEMARTTPNDVTVRASPSIGITLDEATLDRATSRVAPRSASASSFRRRAGHGRWLPSSGRSRRRGARS
ncbi:MAG: hypothetical protein KIS78_23225 [Labilithrix sp.]|nr:hypothetical protein [Labilithrix sp.]